MSFFHIVNMKFLLCNVFISKIEDILMAYKGLFSSGHCVDSIKLLISNWSRGSTPIENKKKISFNNWQTLKVDDYVCESLERFNQIFYDTYLTNKCLYLVQNLIDDYTIDSSIIKFALPNLLSIMELQSRIESFLQQSHGRLTFPKKLLHISRFMKRKIYHIVYREIYFAYLIQERDNKLQKISMRMISTLKSNDVNNEATFHVQENGEFLDVSTSTIIMSTEKIQHVEVNEKQDQHQESKSSVNFHHIQDLVLQTHLTKLTEIKTVRNVNTELLKYYSIQRVKQIAIENLKNIIQVIFNLNSSKFIDLLVQCGAILSGSITEQCIHDNSISYNPESDVDIYVPRSKLHNATSLVEFILSAGYTEYAETQPVISNDSHFLPRSLGYRFNHSIDAITTFKNEQTGRKIQVISVCNSNGMSTFEFGKFVVSSFDLTFLMNFFDGVTLHVQDFHGVIKKHGSVTSYVADKCTLTFSNLNEGDKSLRVWYSATMATILRVIKYQGRGYQIDNIPHFSLVKQVKI